MLFRSRRLHVVLAAGVDGNEDDMKAPWHFKVLMVLLALYLGYRVVQLFI